MLTFACFQTGNIRKVLENTGKLGLFCKKDFALAGWFGMGGGIAVTRMGVYSFLDFSSVIDEQPNGLDLTFRTARVAFFGD